jgi:hypothetical protein
MNAPEYCIQEIKINNEKAFKETWKNWEN